MRGVDFIADRGCFSLVHALFLRSFDVNYRQCQEFSTSLSFVGSAGFDDAKTVNLS